jgi:hypothetical protein
MPFGPWPGFAKKLLNAVSFATHEVVQLLSTVEITQPILAAEDIVDWLVNATGNTSSERIFRLILKGSRVIGAIISGAGVQVPSGPGRGYFFDQLGGGRTYFYYEINDPAINVAVNGEDAPWKLYRNVLFINVPPGQNGGAFFDGSFHNGMNYSPNGVGGADGVRVSGGGVNRVHVNAAGLSFNAVATPIATPSIGATLTNNASGGTAGVIAANGGGTVWSTDSTAVFGNINQLAIAVLNLQTQLKLLGLVVT